MRRRRRRRAGKRERRAKGVGRPPGPYVGFEAASGLTLWAAGRRGTGTVAREHGPRVETEIASHDVVPEGIRCVNETPKAKDASETANHVMLHAVLRF